MPASPQLAPISVADLLGHVAEGLHDLRQEGRLLEDAIAAAILGEEPTQHATLGNLQRIDLIVQALGELALYVAALAERLPQDERIDVSTLLARMTLRDLAGTLAGRPRQKVVDGASNISGEVDLF